MEPEILKFEDIVRGCLKKWKSILIFTILTTLLGVIVAAFSKENIRYQGIFKVMVKEDLVNEENSLVSEKDTSLIPNYIELIRTRDFMENVVERMNLNVDAKVVLSTLNLVNIDKSDFIQVKYTSPSKEQTEKVLEGIEAELLDVVSTQENVNAKRIESINITVLDESTSKKLIVLMAFFAGLALSSLLAFILECTNKTFKTKGELERELKLNVLGNLPKADKDKEVLVNSNNVDRSYLEALKSLALDIKYGDKNKNLKSISVVSSCENEGNTTLTANLALLLSESNKVMLLDADIRRDSISQLLKITSNKGLSDLLTNYNGEVIYKYSENLDVITSGNNKNSLVSLDKNEFSNLIIDLKDKYDYLIINTPSIIENADFKVVLSKVDGVLFNIKAEGTKKNIAKEALKSINYLGVNLVGVIFNFGDKFRNKYYQ